MNPSAALGLVVLAVLLPACTSGGPQASPSPSSPASPSASAVATTAPVSPSPSATPVPAGFDPRSASFVSPRRGWVLGTTAGARTGVVVETRDGGATWSAAGTIPVQVGADLNGRPYISAIRFLSDSVGWAYGDTAYVTRDGGATWREAAMPEGRTLVSIAASGTTTYALLGAKPSEHLVEDAAVWTGTVGSHTLRRADAAGAVAPFEDLVARGSTVLFETDRAYPGVRYRVSTDSGRTWETRRPCADDEDLRDVTAASERDLVFACDGRTTRTLRVSADGGKTTSLRLREPRTSSNGSIAAATPTAVTRTPDSPSAQRNAMLQWSGDGGRTFRQAGPAPAPSGATSWSEPRFVDGSFGTILRAVAQPSGVRRELYVTRDAGATWKPVAYT